MVDIKDRSWQSCGYAVPAGGKNDLGFYLRGNGIHETYACRNNAVIGSGRFKTEPILDGGVPLKMAILTRTETPRRYSNQELDDLKQLIYQDLNCCISCIHFQANSKATVK